MLRTILLFICLIAGFQQLAFTQNLQAEFAMAEFLAPDDKPYLETYLKLKGNTLKQVESESGSYSEVLITYHVSDGVWVPFKDTYKVRGPLNSNGSAPLDFIDQRRIPLRPGIFQLEVTIEDVNDSTDFKAVVKQSIEIQRKGKIIPDTTNTVGNQSEKPFIFKAGYFLSDVQLVASFSKSEKPNILTKAGYDLVPYTSDFYPSSVDQLSLYIEVYNTMEYFNSKYYGDLLGLKNAESEEINAKRGKEFLINVYVENADNGKVVTGLRKFYKREAAKIVPLLHSFPIDQLGTGNYNLVVEIRDQQNAMLDKRLTFFQRLNNVAEEATAYLPESGDVKEHYGTFVSNYQNLDQLKDFLRCLHPISSQNEIWEVNTRMNFKDIEAMRKFLYNFWKVRNPENPEEAWLKYWAEVEKVNAAYSTNHKKGYDTDRGRVYLQYGPPNTITPSYFEPNTYPYEIWHYYTLKDDTYADQTNRKFVFANMEGATKEFDLIHSDAKNEITNARWHHDLHSRSSQSINFDVEDAGGQYGSRSRDFFENPY
jgi:GWxTD domain-containing protein